MKTLDVEELRFTPFFDLEASMLMSGSKRIQGDVAKRRERDWLRLHGRLKGYKLGRRRGYLLIHLDSDLEEEIDTAAKDDPQRGEELETIARSLIMVSLMEKVPQAGFGSCAPVPESNKRLKRTLASLGLDLTANGLVNLRYGLITRLPFSDDCDGCFISSSCVKRILSKG